MYDYLERGHTFTEQQYAILNNDDDDENHAITLKRIQQNGTARNFLATIEKPS